MIRTQIYLDPEQHRFLENMSFILGKKERKRISISEVIRRAIENFKADSPKMSEEEMTLYAMTTNPGSSLKEVWDNEKDAEYDKI